MALKIAKNSGLTDIVSTGQLPYRKKADGTQVDAIPQGSESLYEANPAYNPLTTSHPIAGGTQEQKVYLFNDAISKYYTGVNIDPTDIVSTDESGWVFLAPDNAGVAGTYGAASAPLSMANIGVAGSGDTTGKPFWVKVVSPSVGTTQNKTDIKLTVNFTEFAV
jgi:hypothetical protein